MDTSFNLLPYLGEWSKNLVKLTLNHFFKYGLELAHVQSPSKQGNGV